MKLKLYKFGDMLVSRPSGREAYLSAKAYIFTGKPDTVRFDFEGVKVLTPSWIDEFTTLLKKDYPKVKTVFLPSKNPTVIASLKVLPQSEE